MAAPKTLPSSRIPLRSGRRFMYAACIATVACTSPAPSPPFPVPQEPDARAPSPDGAVVGFDAAPPPDVVVFGFDVQSLAAATTAQRRGSWMPHDHERSRR